MNRMNRYDHRSPRIKALRMVGMVIFGMVSAVVFALAFGLFVQWLWNWLMPEIFHIGKIGFWQSFGIILLVRLIFGSFHMYDHKPHRHYHHSHACNGERGGERNYNQWKINGTWRDWDHYDQWWHAEGKEAFEKYIEKIKNESKDHHQ